MSKEMFKSRMVYVVACALCAAPLLCFFISWRFEKLAQLDEFNTIILAKPALQTSLDGLTLGSSGILFLMFVYAAMKKQKPLWAILLAILAINFWNYGLVIGIILTQTSWDATWTMEDSTRGTDGNIYYFLNEGIVFGPGFSNALARQESDNPLWFKAKILGSMSEHQRTAPILRPKPFKRTTEDERKRIYSSANGWVACFNGSECVVAYNIKNKRSYTHLALRTLSSFILVGTKSHSRKSP